VAYEFLSPIRGMVLFLRTRLENLNSHESDIRVKVFDSLNQVDYAERIVSILNEACKEKAHNKHVCPTTQVLHAALNPDDASDGELMFLAPYLTVQKTAPQKIAMITKDRNAHSARDFPHKVRKSNESGGQRSKRHVRNLIRNTDRQNVEDVEEKEKEEEKGDVERVEPGEVIDILKISSVKNPLLSATRNEDDIEFDDELDTQSFAYTNSDMFFKISTTVHPEEEIDLSRRPSAVYRRLSSTIIAPYEERNNFGSIRLREKWDPDEFIPKRESSLSSKRLTAVNIDFSRLRRAAGSVGTIPVTADLKTSTRRHDILHTDAKIGLMPLFRNNERVSSLSPDALALLKSSIS